METGIATRARHPSKIFGAMSENSLGGSLTALIEASFPASTCIVFRLTLPGSLLMDAHTRACRAGVLTRLLSRLGRPGRGRLVLTGVGVVAGLGDQRAHPGRDRRGDPAGDPRGERRLRLPKRRPDHPAEPDLGRRLDLLGPHLGEQRLADPLDPPLLAADVMGQPLRQLLRVRHTALTEPQELPHRRPVPFHRPTLPVEQAQIRRGHLHLLGDVGDRVVMQLRAAIGEPAVRGVELQEQRQRRPATPPDPAPGRVGDATLDGTAAASMGCRARAAARTVTNAAPRAGAYPPYGWGGAAGLLLATKDL